MIAFLMANKMALLMCLYTLLNIINASLKDSKEKSAIGWVLNAISFLTRSDAPGTIKAPLVK